jgi:hypothetical protein
MYRTGGLRSPMREQGVKIMKNSDELLSRLQNVRSDMAAAPWPQRIEALRSCLKAELGSVSRSEALTNLTKIRASMEAGAGSEQGDWKVEVDQLNAECKRLRQDRDHLRIELSAAEALQDEVDRLKEDKARLESSLDRMKRNKPGGSGGGLAAVREGLVQALEGRMPDPDDLGLADDDAALFRALCEVILFALNYDLGVNTLIWDISGTMDVQSTTTSLQNRQIFKRLFLTSVQGEADSQEELKDILQKNLKFLLLMNLAYLNCIRDGSQRLLVELDPQQILSRHKRFMGFDFESAFKEIRRLHGDRANLTRSELWETYFSHKCREELAEYLTE